MDASIGAPRADVAAGTVPPLDLATIVVLRTAWLIEPGARVLHLKYAPHDSVHEVTTPVRAIVRLFGGNTADVALWKDRR